MNSQHIDKSAQRLIWVDLEMTGLDTMRDEILEMAVIVTDAQLNEVATAPVMVIRHPESRLQAMDDWNTKTHGESGLWQRVLESQHTYASAEAEMLAFLHQWVPESTSPMCGNSICQDRRFMARLMPRLEAFFHYRNLDVSTIKELATRWCPTVAAGYFKESRHEALSDIRDSIDELQYFRRFMGKFSA